MISDGQWRERPCFIVGGGPSLKNFRWVRLEGSLHIATNMAFRTCPAAQILFTRDRRWIATYRKDPQYRQHQGLKVYHRVEPGDFPEIPVQLGQSEHWGTHLWEGLVWTKNTGLAAVHLADILGANPIYLLGFDMKGEDGRSANWHREYQGFWAHGEERYQTHVHEFLKYRSQWRARVYNLCVNGALAPHLRTKDVDEVLG